jgi:DNA processing protein
MRNATMSGYGLATIVVEAGEHSGARAQARMAVEHGRPVILTDLVVQSTQWGKSYVGRPGVSVASSTSEAMQIVDQIREEASRIDTALGDLVAV